MQADDFKKIKDRVLKGGSEKDHAKNTAQGKLFAVSVLPA